MEAVFEWEIGKRKRYEVIRALQNLANGNPDTIYSLL